MYRTPPPNFPPPPDPLLVVPGEGLRGIWVGRATAADVLREFGEDCQISKQDNGDVFKIDYGSDQHDAYLPDRPAQAARPHNFDFDFGLLESIQVGPYQTELVVAGGIRYGSSRAQVLTVLGHDHVVLDHGTFESMRYSHLGIEVSLSSSKPFAVAGYVIFRAAR